MSKKFISLLSMAVLLIQLLAGQAWAASDKLKDTFTYNSEPVPIDYDNSQDSLHYYHECVDSIKAQQPLTADVVLKPEDALTDNEESARLSTESDGSVCLVTENKKDYKWSFIIQKAGYGIVQLEYEPLEGNSGTITRQISINGSIPFIESQSVSFDRQYQDEGDIKKAANGDDIRPTTKEVIAWSDKAAFDSGGLYEEPLCYSFHAGTNTLQLSYVSGNMKIRSVRIAVPEKVPTYQEYLDESPKSIGDVSSAADLQWEAEDDNFRSDPSIRTVCDSDAATTPYSGGNNRLNMLGDSRWCTGNQWAEWPFYVKETGYYTVAFRAAQWYNDGRSSYRQVTIDDKVPFSELLAYEIPYSRGWQNVILSNEQGEPFRIYLEEGKHTIRLTTKIGSIASVLNELSRASADMSDVLSSVIKVTGYDIDPNYSYELEKKVPDVLDKLNAVMDRVHTMLNTMQTRKNKSSLYYSLLSAQKLLSEVTGNPDRITVQYGELSNLQSNFGTWMDQIRSNALSIDKFYIYSPSSVLPKPRANVWLNLVSLCKSFFRSFTKDYNNISGMDGMGKDPLKVWVSLGREWTEALRDLVDNEFSTQYHTNVELNLFPSGQLNAGSSNALILAVNSGLAPDACIGVAASSVGEFAMRDVAADLTQQEDFASFSNWFITNAFVPFTYQSGIYGVPCTQDFTVLFYRKDILSNLGLGIPQTWNDVYYMIAKLNASGYQFYYPPNPAPFIYQNGADYYSADLKKSGVDSAAFQKGFEQYTELFINYGVPTAANFFNRFRSGEMPIGVGSYDLYLSLTTAAPELKGRWGMYMLPGIQKEDSTIDRSVSSGSSTANIILNSSSKQDEAWQFLKWFMSENVQVEYGDLVEAIVGLGARWNSANLAAFQRLPWSNEEIEVITTQWKYNREIPVVPGSYATTRYLGFAWTDIVISGKSIRSTLEESAESINREIKKKYKEFSKREEVVS